MNLEYSIEMNSRDHLKTITVTSSKHEMVLFEGALGELVGISIEKEGLLVVCGSEGVLRLAIDVSEIQKILENKDGGIITHSAQLGV